MTDRDEDVHTAVNGGTLLLAASGRLQRNTRSSRHGVARGRQQERLQSSSARPLQPLELDSKPDGLMRSKIVTELEASQKSAHEDFWQTIAGVSGNVLEWYDFAIFGFLAPVIGEVFFPPQAGNAATIESFVVFGSAFLMRPVGGTLMGYIGDIYGHKRALVLSIFLMAFPTFLMGCLPGYQHVGVLAIVLLILVRLLQGLSVGGQLMSSLVFTLESHDQSKWGLYGSYVMAAANIGTLLGSIAGSALSSSLTHEQLVTWGWRVPFLSGIVVSFSGCYLRSHGGESHLPGEGDSERRRPNPLRLAFSKGNRRSLAAATLVPMLWSGGFYLSFVWMADLMSDPELNPNTVPHAFAVNSLSLLLSVCLLFPVAGILSDLYGRRRIMTIGGFAMAVLSPIVVMLICKGNPWTAVVSQSLLGVALSLWGAPMCAWLVESFEPGARLTSVAIGYNLAHAIAGGSAPAVATIMVGSLGPSSPGWLLTALAALSMFGLWVVAPPSPPTGSTATSPSNKDFTAIPTDTHHSSYLEDENEII